MALLCPVVAVVASHIEHPLRLGFLVATVDSLLAQLPPFADVGKAEDVNVAAVAGGSASPLLAVTSDAGFPSVTILPDAILPQPGFALCGIVISLSYPADAPAAVTTAVAAVASLLRERSSLVLAVLEQPRPLRQFEHIAAAVQWVGSGSGAAAAGPRPAYALLLDDDDLAHPALLATYTTYFAGLVLLDTVVTCDRLTSAVDIEGQRRTDVDFAGMCQVVGPAASLGKFIDFSASLVGWETLEAFVSTRSDVLDSRYADGFFRMAMTTQLHCPVPLLWQRRWRRVDEVAAWQADLV